MAIQVAFGINLGEGFTGATGPTRKPKKSAPKPPWWDRLVMFKMNMAARKGKTKAR